jgi:hypothetical protein
VLISFFHTRQIEPLRGTYKKIERPGFSWPAWFSGDYQKKMDQRSNSKFFLRSVLIKIRNQIDFDLFDKVNADVVAKGKNNMLFDKLYLESYLGNNFLGESIINNKIHKLKAIQDSLTNWNKQLLVVIAPSKADYFLDQFPIAYEGKQKKTSNYDYYTQQLIENNINHIDFNKLFLEMKDSSSYPLYPKHGTHWNNYARFFVWNTIAEKLEENSYLKLAKLQESKIELLPSHGRDNDLRHLLNIYNLEDTTQYAYRTYAINSDLIDRPRGLVIADSYYWGLFSEGFSKEVLGAGMYWYYNTTIHSNKPKVRGVAKDYDLRKVLRENEIVILLSTAANLHDFPFGFEEDAYSAIQDTSSLEQIKEEQINRMIRRIENNKEWFSDLKNKAQEERLVLDSLLYENAVYYLKQNKIID